MEEEREHLIENLHIGQDETIVIANIENISLSVGLQGCAVLVVVNRDTNQALVMHHGQEVGHSNFNPQDNEVWNYIKDDSEAVTKDVAYISESIKSFVKEVHESNALYYVTIKSEFDKSQDILNSMINKCEKVGLDFNKMTKIEDRKYNTCGSKFKFDFTIDLNDLSIKSIQSEQTSKATMKTQSKIPESVINFIDSRKDKEVLEKMPICDMAVFLRAESKYQANKNSLESNCVSKIDKYSSPVAKCVSSCADYPKGHPNDQRREKGKSTTTGTSYTLDAEYKTFTQSYLIQKSISDIMNKSR